MSVVHDLSAGFQRRTIKRNGARLHVTVVGVYMHHRPGADDAAGLSAAFRGDSGSPETLSRTLSRTAGFETN